MVIANISTWMDAGTTSAGTIGNWVLTTAATTVDTTAHITLTGGGLTTWAPSVTWNDSQEQAKRRPPPREFNRYISTSDLLDEFIKFLGEQGVRQREVFKMPMEFFIKWLVIRACEEDQEEPNVELPALPVPKVQHRCLGCGRFMALAILLPLHGAKCAEAYFLRPVSIEAPDGN